MLRSSSRITRGLPIGVEPSGSLTFRPSSSSCFHALPGPVFRPRCENWSSSQSYIHESIFPLVARHFRSLRSLYKENLILYVALVFISTGAFTDVYTYWHLGRARRVWSHKKTTCNSQVSWYMRGCNSMQFFIYCQYRYWEPNIFNRQYDNWFDFRAA